MHPHGKHHGPFGSGFGHGRLMGMGSQVRRGDVQPAVIALLKEQPMHGYQIIQELSERSGGAWTPSAGSIYPTLQLLADEGLVTGEEIGGKQVFRLTEAGRRVAETLPEQAPVGRGRRRARTRPAGFARSPRPHDGDGAGRALRQPRPDREDRRHPDRRPQELYAILAED